jgi:uncharacterized repeat protein (TIGR01451 family)
MVPVDLTLDFGFVKLVSVGDYVWIDVNRDGQQSAGEPPVAGVVVNLYDSTGALVGTTTTDAHGFYVFTDLVAGTDYSIEFVPPAGSTFTTALVGDSTSDSDADVVTGKVAFTAPGTGTNSATTPDNPTLDAGLVILNLTLTKTTSAGSVKVGDQVSFTLIPHNDGPADALAGWTVTEVPPAGLTLVSMSGSGYTCAGATCTAADVLKADTDGPAITVVAKVTGGDLHNVAYVRPEPKDVPETNRLGSPPPAGTSTDRTTTDNDAQAILTLAGQVPVTGLDVLPIAGFAFALLIVGGALLLVRRR